MGALLLEHARPASPIRVVVVKRRHEIARSIVVFAVAHGLSGCSSGLPAAPTPSELPAPPLPAPTVAAEQWKLTSTLKSVEGPEACLPIFAEDIGQPSDFSMEIQRSGDHAIQFAYDVGNPEVNENLRGHRGG